MTIPSDTVISMRMDSYLGSRSSHVGDRFTATVTIPVYVNGRTAIPAGSKVEGRVTQVTPAKRMSKSGSIAIDFDTLIFPNGSRVALVGSLTSDDPEMRDQIDDEGRVSGDADKRNVVFVGGGGAIGAVLGGIAGGSKGAVLGGIAGAGAGIAGVLLSKGEEAEVPQGTPFGINLRQPLEISDGNVSETGFGRDDRNDPYPDQGVGSNDPGPVPGRDADRDNGGYRRDRQPERTYPTPVPDRRQPDPDPDQPNTDDRFPDDGTNQPDSSVEDNASSEPEPAPDTSNLPLSSPEMVRRAQGALRDRGYYEGPIDGQMSPRTSNALKVYQRENKLPETGDLDPGTAKSLGMLGTAPPVTRRPEPVSNSRKPEASSKPVVVLANVISANANRLPGGGIRIVIATQANTGGWRWYGEHVVNGDTLEVYARAVQPDGIATQVLTRGQIELNVKDKVDYVHQVIVHGAGGDVSIPLGNVQTGTTQMGTVQTGAIQTASTGVSLQRQAEELLAEYQRILGVKMTGTGVELNGRGRYGEPEIELLFAIDSFANAAQLYSRLLTSLSDSEGKRGAALALARQARRTDAVFTTTTTRTADSLGSRWDAIRQDILRLMQNFRISSSDLDL